MREFAPLNTISDGEWADICARAEKQQAAELDARGADWLTDPEQIARRHASAEQHRLRNWS